MKAQRLIRVMGKIACHLVECFFTDLKTQNTLSESNGDIPFIWLICPHETRLFMFDRYDWGTKLASRITFHGEFDEEMIFYYYDGEKLIQIFCAKALSMAEQQKQSGDYYRTAPVTCPYDKVFQIPFNQ